MDAVRLDRLKPGDRFAVKALRDLQGTVLRVSEGGVLVAIERVGKIKDIDVVRKERTTISGGTEVLMMSPTTTKDTV